MPPFPLALQPCSPRAVLLFDVDGVIRDVSGSYRRALAETVHHYSGQRPDPSAIDALKAEGVWNNDWEASLELLRRSAERDGTSDTMALPPFAELVKVFSSLYFGGDPEGDPALWRGFIGSEPLQVDHGFFGTLADAGIAWGFVSGAEPPSLRYVLIERLGLADPPLIAMGDAPDKPDPTGLLRLAAELVGKQAGTRLGPEAPPLAYLGDTVADVRTVLRARAEGPAGQRLISLAVAPPHLHRRGQEAARAQYEGVLRRAGADRVIRRTADVLEALRQELARVEGRGRSSPPGAEPLPSPPGNEA